MLDCPGVIPANFKDQVAAQRLAMCNDIGEASYLSSVIAAQLLSELIKLGNPRIIQRIQNRYKLDLNIGMEEFVLSLGNKLFVGDIEKAGARILKDFRDLKFGSIALELPSMMEGHY